MRWYTTDEVRKILNALDKMEDGSPFVQVCVPEVSPMGGFATRLELVGLCVDAYKGTGVFVGLP